MSPAYDPFTQPDEFVSVQKWKLGITLLIFGIIGIAKACG